MYEYPERKAVQTWTHSGASCSILKTEVGHYCGYVRIPKRLTTEEGYNGIMTYVPVHGGITYAREDKDGSMVYGFDCAHAGDESKPHTRELVWLREECERLVNGLRAAAEYEGAYLESEGTVRGEVIDAMHDMLRDKHGIDFEVRGNFGAMINIMCGRL